MKIYLITQSRNNGWDTYSDAVVVAENEEEARKIHPRGVEFPEETSEYGDWAPYEFVEVEYIGEAKKELNEKEVICASFHAG